MTHYVERLERDIEVIRSSLKGLGERVGKALSDARRVFLSHDMDLAYHTVLGDHQLNRDASHIDHLCHAFIARHAPSAGHLRLMSAAIRVSIALERIGDYAVTICREAMQMGKPPNDRVARELDSVGEESHRLLLQAVSEFVNGNPDGARALMPLTQHVEGVMPGIYDELIEGESISRSDMLAEFVVFSLLKRVADQAKNICDQTVFAVAGEDKPRKTLKVLFVGDDRCGDCKVAELVGNKQFGKRSVFDSAGRTSGAEPAPGLATLLDKLEIDAQPGEAKPLAEVEDRLEDFNIVIVLDGKVGDYFERVPFHTSILHWELSQGEQASLQDRYEALVERLEGLMETVFGDDGK